MPSRAFYTALARSILAGDAAENSIGDRMRKSLGRNWRWIRPLARRFLKRFGAATRPRQKDVVQFLREDEGLFRACVRYRDEIHIAVWVSEPNRMQPVSAASGWMIPPIESVGALAEWLEVSAGELEWFADLKRLTSRG